MRHLRERARRAVCAGMLVAATSALSSTSVEASISGGGQFQGSLTIPTDPCPVQCPLAFTGTFRGSLSGIEVGTHLYTAVFPDPRGGIQSLMVANLSAGALVSDNCPLGLTTPPLTEQASGSFTVTGGALVDTGGGVVQSGISFSAGWTWTGVVAAGLVVEGIGTSAGTVTDAVGHQLASGFIGIGGGLFIPLPPGGVGTCAAPGSAVGIAMGALTELA